MFNSYHPRLREPATMVSNFFFLFSQERILKKHLPLQGSKVTKPHSQCELVLHTLWGCPPKWTHLSNSPRAFHAPYSQKNEVQTPSPEDGSDSPQHSLGEPHREITQPTELLLGTPTLSLSQEFPASLRCRNRRLSWDAGVTHIQVPPEGTHAKPGLRI